MSKVLSKQRAALLAGCAIATIVVGATLAPSPVAAQFVCVGNSTGAAVGDGVVGTTASGANATAAGSALNVACGTQADASGTGINTASGFNAIASGNSSSNTATGNASIASGDNSLNTATGAFANASGANQQHCRDR
jgi:trimeric autotransporter adhesin